MKAALRAGGGSGVLQPPNRAVRWGCSGFRGSFLGNLFGLSAGFLATPLHIGILLRFGPGDDLPGITTRKIVRVSLPGPDSAGVIGIGTHRGRGYRDRDSGLSL